MDKNGKNVNQSGYLIDSDGNIIDKHGNVALKKKILDENGEIPAVYKSGKLLLSSKNSKPSMKQSKEFDKKI